jgi:WD40 repeat protein
MYLMKKIINISVDCICSYNKGLIAACDDTLYIFPDVSIKHSKEDVWEDYIMKVTCTPDGKWIAASSSRGNVAIWSDLKRKEKSLSDECVAAITFSPDGKLLAAGDDLCHVFLLRVPDLSEVAKIGVDGHLISDIAFSPDGKWMAIASEYKCDILELPSLEQVKEIESSEESIKAVAFTSDSKLLAIGDGGVVKILQVPSWRCKKQAELWEVSSLSFSSDLLLGCGLGRAKIWEVPSLREKWETIDDAVKGGAFIGKKVYLALHGIWELEQV